MPSDARAEVVRARARAVAVRGAQTRAYNAAYHALRKARADAEAAREAYAQLRDSVFVSERALSDVAGKRQSIIERAEREVRFFEVRAAADPLHALLTADARAVVTAIEGICEPGYWSDGSDHPAEVEAIKQQLDALPAEEHGALRDYAHARSDVVWDAALSSGALWSHIASYSNVVVGRRDIAARRAATLDTRVDGALRLDRWLWTVAQDDGRALGALRLRFGSSGAEWILRHVNIQSETWENFPESTFRHDKEEPLWPLARAFRAGNRMYNLTLEQASGERHATHYVADDGSGTDLLSRLIVLTP